MLDTIAGSSKLVGDEMGWTLDEFMEFAAKYPDNEVIGAGLTITRKAMLSMIDDASSVTKANDGWRFKYHQTTQEEVDELYALIDAMQFVGFDFSIVTIISEEADSYFSGQKPLEEVVRIIQNRVQLYLEENQ